MQLVCGEEIWRQKTKIMGLPYMVKNYEIMIVGRTMRAQSTNVTDRWTDRFTMTKTTLCIALHGKNGAVSLLPKCNQIHCLPM